MQPRYIYGGGVNANSSTALWTPVDWWRDPIHIGLSATIASSVAASVNVTMDDPTGAFPNLQLNPGYAPPSWHGSSGAKVTSFPSSDVGFTSSGAGSGSSAPFTVIGAIIQPITAIQFVSLSSADVLTILQAGPR